MKKMVKDLQARKYFLVINNPDAKGFTHDVIKDKVRSLRSTTYFCMSDEIGNEEKTLHTHIFIAFSAPVRFSTMKNTFPDAHIEKALGNAQQAKDYILKEAEMLVTDYIKKIENKKFENSRDIMCKYKKLKKYSLVSTILLAISLIVNFI